MSDRPRIESWEDLGPHGSGVWQYVSVPIERVAAIFRVHRDVDGEAEELEFLRYSADGRIMAVPKRVTVTASPALLDERIIRDAEDAAREFLRDDGRSEP